MLKMAAFDTHYSIIVVVKKNDPTSLPHGKRVLLHIKEFM